MNVVRPVIASNGFPYRQMTAIGWHTTSDGNLFVVHGAMDCGQNSCKPVLWCNQLLSGFLANEHLLRVSGLSCLSANDKGDNEM